MSRAFRILEEVGAAPEGLHVKQIARRAGLSVGTAYHLVRTLRYEGYLIRRDSGRYVLGLEIASRFRDLMMTFGHPPRNARDPEPHLEARAVTGQLQVAASDLFQKRSRGEESPRLSG